MSKFQNYSDLDLVKEYQQFNNLEIVGEIFNRHRHIVYGICLKYLANKSAADDALMEVFEELINILQKADIRQFRPWLGTVTRNYLHRIYKTQSKQKHDPLEENHLKNGSEIMEFDENNTLVNDKTEIEEKEKALLDAIDSLKSEQAECIKLFFLEKKSYTEICDYTGYSFKEVKSFIQNGKRNLKIKLEG